MSTFDSIELARFSDDSNRDSDDRVVGKCTPVEVCSCWTEHLLFYAIATHSHRV